MIFKLGYKKKYDLVNVKIYESDISRLKNDKLYEISSDKIQFEKYITDILKNAPSTVNDIYYKYSHFILDNIRLKLHEPGDSLFMFSDSKVIVPIERSDVNQDIITKIIGSLSFYTVGERFNEEYKITKIAEVSKQLTLLLTRLNFRPVNESASITDIARRTLLLLIKTHNDKIDNFRKYLIHLDLTFNLESRYTEFMKENKGKTPEELFDDISTIMSLTSSGLKQIFVSKYGTNSILIFEDLSHYFYLMFMSDLLGYRSAISSYLLNDKDTKPFAERSIQYSTYLVDHLLDT